MGHGEGQFGKRFAEVWLCKLAATPQCMIKLESVGGNMDFLSWPWTWAIDPHIFFAFQLLRIILQTVL